MQSTIYRTTFMKNPLLLLLLSCFSVISMQAKEETPAFPGAEGFGRYTTGGRGGVVLHVTSLEDDGSVGTFRWAVQQAGRRTIVFDVSGTIFLKSALGISNGNLTIAGQTAPGDGICIADYPFTINASNVIIRFLRFRLGNRNMAFHEGDGLGGMDQENIIVDHCSVSWSIDETCSVYGMKNLSLQWCIISQSLRESGHSKGRHGYGGIFGGSGASYHHNLICHHDSRTPRLGPRASTQTDERVDMRNNVIYNWGGNGCYGGEGMNVNIVNNYYKPGPTTKQKSASIQYRIAALGIRTTSYVEDNPAFAPMWHVWGDYFVNGNHMVGFPGVTADNWTNGIYAQINNASVDYTFTSATRDSIRLDEPIPYIATTTHTAEKAYEKVLDFAGASLSRDWLDTQMVYDTRNGVATSTGPISNMPGIIDSQEDNRPLNAPADWSPWPDLRSTAAPLDTDGDGMPDAWEVSRGLDPSNALDRNSVNEAGYTQLEVYLNSLVEHITQGGMEEGTLTGYSVLTNDSYARVVSLAKSTFVGSSTASPWEFEDGYALINSSSKSFATGSEDGIKFSAGVQFRITLPSGILLDSIRFIGYNNYAGNDSYIKEINGLNLPSSVFTFPGKDVNGAYQLRSHKMPFSKPVENSVTFTFEGSQVVSKIELGIRDLTTSLNRPEVDHSTGLVDVYRPDGVMVRRQVSSDGATDGLPKGLYLVGGKKVMLF